MRVHRVHVAPLHEGKVALSGAEAKHLSHVLRVAPGTPVLAFDGAGKEAEGEVAEVEGLRVTLVLSAPRASSREAGLHITLAVGLLKGDKLSQVVRQGTELGVARFCPFTSRHGDVPALSNNKLERLRRIAQEAAKQSGRSVVPEVEAAVSLPDLTLEGVSLVAHPGAPYTLHEAVSKRPDRLTLVTGPEGGLNEAEVEALVTRGARAVRLGARILRAETAPVALAAALLLPEAL